MKEEEAKAWSTIWSAGQGVTGIHDAPPVEVLIADLKTEFKNAIKEQYAHLKTYK